jgi:hypothetical protein
MLPQLSPLGIRPCQQPHPNEDTIAEWIENKLVGFTQNFFELYFHNQYQQKHLETDVVMNIRFPKAYAAGEKKNTRAAPITSTQTSRYWLSKGIRLSMSQPRESQPAVAGT